MSVDGKLKAWEILSVGILSEIDAAAFYARLLGRIRNIHLLEKLKFLALEEEHHRKMLERLFGDRFPEKAVGAPESALMPPIAASLGEGASVLDLFLAGLEAEKTSESFYEEASGRAEDEGGRRMLAYLGRVERSHQAMIRSEIDLLERFPDYYDVEEFNVGQDLFHVGP